MKRIKIFLDRDFFEGDETNKAAMGVGFALGVCMCLLVASLGLVL